MRRRQASVSLQPQLWQRLSSWSVSVWEIRLQWAATQVYISQKTSRMIQLNKKIQTWAIQAYYTADKAVTPRHTHTTQAGEDALKTPLCSTSPLLLSKNWLSTRWKKITFSAWYLLWSQFISHFFHLNEKPVQIYECNCIYLWFQVCDALIFQVITCWGRCKRRDCFQLELFWSLPGSNISAHLLNPDSRQTQYEVLFMM